MTAEPKDPADVAWTQRPYQLPNPSAMPHQGPKRGQGIRVRSRVDDGFVTVGTIGRAFGWNSVMTVWFDDDTSARMSSARMSSSELELLEGPSE